MSLDISTVVGSLVGVGIGTNDTVTHTFTFTTYADVQVLLGLLGMGSLTTVNFDYNIIVNSGVTLVLNSTTGINRTYNLTDISGAINSTFINNGAVHVDTVSGSVAFNIESGEELINNDNLTIASSSTLTIAASGTLTNTSFVILNTGTLTNNGTLALTGTSTLMGHSGTNTITQAGTFTLADTSQIDLRGGSTTNFNIDSDMTISSGTSLFCGQECVDGDTTTTVDTGVTLNVDGGVTVHDDFENNGTVSVNVGGSFYFSTSYGTLTGSITDNGGSIDLLVDYGCGGGVACFLKGTKILTPTGYVNVEDLKKSDLIQLNNGKTTQIKLMTDFKLRPNEKTLPFKVPKGKFNAIEDLYITPAHGLRVRNFFIPACQIKGLEQEKETEEKVLTYYHITTDNFLKDTIIANGVACETFYDYTCLTPQIIKKYKDLRVYNKGFRRVEGTKDDLSTVWSYVNVQTRKAICKKDKSKSN